MLRMNSSFGRARLHHATRPSASPWICQACQIHGSTLLSSRLDKVSFPAPKPKKERVDPAVAAEEKKKLQEQQEQDHQDYIVRLEQHLKQIKETIEAENNATRRTRARRQMTMAKDILQKAKKLPTTPYGWPLLHRKKIISQAALTSAHKVASKTMVKDSSPETTTEDEIPSDETAGTKRNYKSPKEKKLEVDATEIRPSDVELEPIHVDQNVELRPLSHGLDRVLFNPGVTFLRDPRSKVYNFDPYLDTIMPVDEFDFDALGSYIKSSKDDTLMNLAKESGKKYVGSTSSMTSILSHLHYLVSRWRPLNLNMLSKGFVTESSNFTRLSRLPISAILRYKDGVYAIDQDKSSDSTESILLFLGRSMEKMLTMPPDTFRKYHKSASHEIPEEVKNARERYHYTGYKDLLFRSQLDAIDDRLPGSGVFDLKTRGVVSIRMNVQIPQAGWGYQIKTADGQFESFEREYYDLIRSAFMKYSLQVRMGRMDGCFVAYHNTKRIFGFQYISIDEMDEALHGSSRVGEQEFKLSLRLLNEALDRATAKYPEQSLRLWFETRESTMPFLYFGAEPITEEELAATQEGESDINVVLEQLKAPIPSKRSLNWKGIVPEPADGESNPALSPMRDLLDEGIATLDKEAESLRETAKTSREGGEEGAKGVLTDDIKEESEIESEEFNEEGSRVLEEGLREEGASESEIDAENEVLEEGEAAEEAAQTAEGDEVAEELQDSEVAEANLEMGAETREDTGTTESARKLATKPKESTENKPSNENATETPTPKPEEPTERPVFMQVLVTQNLVNGVKVDRPNNLKERDTWSLNYAFLDMEDAAAQKTMRQMKKRKEEGVEYDVNWRSAFLSHLMQLSRDGERYSQMQKKADEEGEIVVYRRRD
ncbi:hypothetical protein ABW19_dt0205627 [Dactylella cylindrospora]|nr:hypothetical protein ABW19_dt0205627 [Dactylella cylindrospora]